MNTFILLQEADDLEQLCLDETGGSFSMQAGESWQGVVPVVLWHLGGGKPWHIQTTCEASFSIPKVWGVQSSALPQLRVEMEETPCVAHPMRPLGFGEPHVQVRACEQVPWPMASYCPRSAHVSLLSTSCPSDGPSSRKFICLGLWWLKFIE